MSTKLFIQNLTEDVDSTELESMFATVGNVVSAVVQVIPGPHNNRCVGYVEMETEEAAKDGIEHYNGRIKGGMILSVRVDKPHVPDPNFVVPKRPKPVFFAKKNTKRPSL